MNEDECEIPVGDGNHVITNNERTEVESSKSCVDVVVNEQKLPGNSEGTDRHKDTEMMTDKSDVIGGKTIINTEMSEINSVKDVSTSEEIEYIKNHYKQMEVTVEGEGNNDVDVEIEVENNGNVKGDGIDYENENV